MLFEEFNKQVNNAEIKGVKIIFIEKNILPLFTSSESKYKFKLESSEGKKNVLIYNSPSSNFFPGLDEHSEKEKKEKSEEFGSFVNYKEDNFDKNNNNPQEVINSHNDNNYLEIDLYTGKNLLFLFNKGKKIIIICSLGEQSSENSNYYYLDVLIVLKYRHFEYRIIKEIKDYNWDAGLLQYAQQKLNGIKNKNLNENIIDIQLYIENIINFDNKNNIKDKPNNIQNNIKSELNNNNSNKINPNNFNNNEERKKELNPEINNFISNTREENSNNVSKENQKKTLFGADSYRSQTTNNEDTNKCIEKNSLEYNRTLRVPGIFETSTDYKINNFKKCSKLAAYIASWPIFFLIWLCIIILLIKWIIKTIFNNGK